MNNNKKILIIGDLHLGRIGYSEYVDRDKEINDILDFIIQNSNDCETVVFLGDQFEIKNPSSNTIKSFTSFIEKFNNKKLFIISGNHETRASGESALDYLREIKNKNWTIITNEIHEEKGLIFCPYFSNAFLEADNNKEAVKKIMSMLPDGKILFLHHAIEGMKTISGILVDDFPEAILPKKEISNKYEKIFGGHIHSNFEYDNIFLVGSIFNNEVGEVGKYIHKLDIDTLQIEKIKLPGRKIIKIENPTDELIGSIPKDSIVKVIITEKKPSGEILELKEKLKKQFSKNGTFLLVEKIKKERERTHYDSEIGITEMSIDSLLKIYSEQKKVDLVKLKNGFELIR